MKELSPIQRNLNDQLDNCRSFMESLGAEINGYAGGSPEGDIWQYSFSFTSPLPPDRAAITLRTYWKHGYQEAPSDDFEIRSECSIFREGSPSRFSKFDKKILKISSPIFDLKKLLISEYERSKKELEAEANQVLNFV